MKNLLLRSITGILFVGVVVGCILWNAISFAALFTIVSVLTIIEFGKLANEYQKTSISQRITALGGATLFLSFTGYFTQVIGPVVFIPYLLIILFLLIRELYLKRSNPVDNWAYSMFSQMYIALPFALLNVLAFHSNSEMTEVSYNPILPLSVFIFLWVYDTGAYAIGSMFGKHRLFERVSPKKSWEGFFGGLVIAMLVALILAHNFTIMSTLEWIGLAFTIVVFGTWGDLTESLFKRHFGIKDSGSILPGHGGMLDRFDSSLLAIPAAAIYLYVLTMI